MRGATWLLAVSAACSSTPAPPPFDAGTIDAGVDAMEASAPQIKLTPYGDVFVPRGQTVTASVGTFQVVGITIDIIDLPPGVSAKAAQTDSYGNASIAVTATADAPVSDVTALAVAYDASGMRGSAPIRVAVTSTEGALDPSFGTGGVAKPPFSSNVATLAFTPDGHLAVAATSQKPSCELAHLAPDGSLDSTFAVVELTPFANAFCDDMAIDASGDVAMLVQSQSQHALVLMDASGTIGSTTTLFSSARYVAWTGAGWFTSSPYAVTSAVSTQGVETQVTLPLGQYFGLAAGGDGSVLIVGIVSNQTAIAYKLVPTTSGGYDLDATFGSSGAGDLGPTAVSAYAAVSDASGGFFVAVDSSIVHLGASGQRLCTLDVPMQGLAKLVRLPSGDVIAFGALGYNLASVRMRADCTLVPSYGAFGFTETSELQGNHPITVAYDGSAYLYASTGAQLARFTLSP